MSDYVTYVFIAHGFYILFETVLNGKAYVNAINVANANSHGFRLPKGTGSLEPTSDYEVANKRYVDNIVSLAN